MSVFSILQYLIWNLTSEVCLNMLQNEDVQNHNEDFLKAASDFYSVTSVSELELTSRSRRMECAESFSKCWFSLGLVQVLVWSSPGPG